LSLPKGRVSDVKTESVERLRMGAKKGSFDRLLRFCNVVLFGPDSKVRLQNEFKAHVQEVVETGLVTVLRNAKGRRYENKGMRITGPNVVGAFADWAGVLEPRLCDEFLRVRRVVDYYTPDMIHKDTQTRLNKASRAKARVLAKYGGLMKENVAKWQETGAKHVIKYDPEMSAEDKRVFARLFQAQKLKSKS
jgi:hypothetical protein